MRNWHYRNLASVQQKLDALQGQAGEPDALVRLMLENSPPLAKPQPVQSAPPAPLPAPVTETVARWLPPLGQMTKVLEAFRPRARDRQLLTSDG